MIRVVIFLILVGLLALGAAWLADRPGDVVVTWQGMHIETSVMVLAAGLLVAVAALMLLWTLLERSAAVALHLAPALASPPGRARL